MSLLIVLGIVAALFFLLSLPKLIIWTVSTNMPIVNYSSAEYNYWNYCKKNINLTLPSAGDFWAQMEEKYSR